MTSRERIMTALRNGQPDRVPVFDGASDMIPARLAGKPSWDIYINNDPPLWKAYLDTVKYFGSDGWFLGGEIKFKTKPAVEVESKITYKGTDRWDVRTIYHTPAGDLTDLCAVPADNPPTHIEKLVKDFKEDFEKFKYIFPEITGYDDTLFKQQKNELGESGIMSVCVLTPGLQSLVHYFHGNLEALTYAYYDYPEMFMELCGIQEKYYLAQLEIALEAGTDSILTGGSGSLTLQSPDIWRELSLPTLKKITRLCKEAGVISIVHSCGKERYIVEACANETDLDAIHPLETPPMGDCDLAECKSRFGNRLALMGNLHTTEIMLNGKPEDVRHESLKAILAAGMGGGYVLTSGDQVGRDTPDENMFAMINAAKELGRYPLDRGRIEEEIARLERKRQA